jgi:hypothetical protein
VLFFLQQHVIRADYAAPFTHSDGNGSLLLPLDVQHGKEKVL